MNRRVAVTCRGDGKAGQTARHLIQASPPRVRESTKECTMLTKPLAQALNEQIASEFSASNHYLAIATYFAQRSLDGWAAFFFRQSDEERTHGMKILTYLIDNAAEATLPAVDEARTDFPDALTAVKSALESERKVTRQFN